MKESEGNQIEKRRAPSDAFVQAEGATAVYDTVMIRPTTDAQHSIVDGSVGPYVDRRYVELTLDKSEK